MVQIAGAMPTDAGSQKFVSPVDPSSGVPKIQRAKAISGDYGAMQVVPGFDSGADMFVVATPGFVVASPRGDVLYIAGIPYAVEYAVIDCASSGDNVIVAARTSLKLLLLSYDVLASGAVQARWRSGTTPLTGPMPFAANGGKIAPFSPVGHLRTAAGVALNLNLSGAVQVGGHIAFVAHP